MQHIAINTLPIRCTVDAAEPDTEPHCLYSITAQIQPHYAFNGET